MKWPLIYLMIYPMQVVLLALLTIWLTRLQDEREDRRHSQSLRPGE
jgi:hypothetical protein